MNAHHTNSALTRRHFVITAATVAGGFAIGIGAAPRLARAATVLPQPWDKEAYDEHEIDAWIAIDPNDSILIRYQRSEMGQGSMTALPMIITEELHCDWSKVRIEYASANRNIRENKIYGDMYSNGSRSVRASQKMLQQVGASARERLIAAAAARWSVPASECTAASERGDAWPTGRTPALRRNRCRTRRRSSSTKSRRSRRRTSSLSSARRCRALTWYTRSTDRQSSASTHRCRTWSSPPSTRALCRAASSRASTNRAAAGAPGVIQVVKLDNAVAVVATGSYWRAKQALARLQPEWDVGEAGSVDSAGLSKAYRAALSEPMLTARNDGDFDQAISGAAKTFEAIYETPYLSHSPMEPMNATVHLQPDRLDVWVGTQVADGGTLKAARVSRPQARAGLYPQRLRGRRLRPARRARRDHAGDPHRQGGQAPVKLVWTREEDTRQDKFRPHAVVGFKAGVGSDGCRPLGRCGW